MVACSEDFHFANDIDGALAIFRSYCYGANVTEAVDLISTDKRKCSFGAIVCIATAY